MPDPTQPRDHADARMAPVDRSPAPPGDPTRAEEPASAGAADRPAHPDAWMTSGAGHPRRWAILGVLVTSLLVVVLDNTILNIALPTIQADLQASQSQLVWAVDSYILVFAALLFTWGVLGDRYGRKKILVLGLLVFVAASTLSAFAPSAPALIAFRALMGIGGAAVLPVTLAIITVVFPPHERGKAIGAWAGAVGAAVALGPVLGGLLLQHPEWSSWLTGNDWGSVFLVNIPIVAIGLFGIIKVVPETRNPHPQRLDLVGLAISVIGLVLLVYGIIHASTVRTFASAEVLVPMLLGVAVLAVFVVVEARSDHKSFDVSLFRNRGYAVSLAAVSLAFFAMSGVTFSLPFYLQILRGYDTLAAGLCFLPFAIGQLLAAPRSAAMVLRFGYRAVMTIGLVIVGISLVGLTNLAIDSPLWLILLTFFLFGFGMGNVIAPASTVMQNVLPLARAGAGSAVQNTVRQVFGALGVAVIGTVLATRYASLVTPVLDQLPEQVPPQAKQAASESIIATVRLVQEGIAQGLPPQTGASILDGAFQAFLSAAHTTNVISAAMVFLAAVIVAVLLPVIHPPRKGGPTGPVRNPTEQLEAREELAYADEAAEQLTRGEPDGRTR